MQTEGCSSLEPGVGIEPTSVIHCCLDVYCGLLRAVLLSAARRLNRSAFGGKAWQKLVQPRHCVRWPPAISTVPLLHCISLPGNSESQGFHSAASLDSGALIAGNPQGIRYPGRVPRIPSKCLIETLARADDAIILSQVNELYTCPNCANSIDNCRCACPYCGETAGCDCAIGHGRATGG